MTEPNFGTEEIDWRTFLTDYPPGSCALVDRALLIAPYTNIKLPELELTCIGRCKTTTYCRGTNAASERRKLFGNYQSYKYALSSSDSTLPFDYIVNYSCENCHWTVKSYSIRFWSYAASDTTYELVKTQKIHEFPLFSPRVPSKVLSLIGPDQELFRKGQHAETQGVGIGAAAYYRRVVENQKNRLIDEVIKVAKHLGATQDVVNELELAKNDTQFGRAIENIKQHIPNQLYIKGHNPFTLLHSALSVAIHYESDEECLKIASSIRLILGEFAQKITDAMKNESNINNAIKNLLEFDQRSKKPTR